MRLTLRTLLAYLDDTLEPAQAKMIGQKVAESDTAQELIARIKQVTRRRRLTAPPTTGPGAKVDPNTIAEYLDNELPPEQLAEVEELCLESDVHLAEIAACHQILTLVLGEPALVPPVARQRMVRLVHGRESIPYRKPAPAVGRTGSDPMRPQDDEADEALLLGLPLYNPLGSQNRWLVPLAAVLLLAVTGLSLFMALPSLTKPDSSVDDSSGEQVAAAPAAPQPVEQDKPAQENVQPKPAADQPKPGQEQPKALDEQPKPVVEQPKPATEQPKPAEERPPAAPTPPGAPEPPSKDRLDAGKYLSAAMAGPSVLLQRAGDKGPWQRLRPGPESRVFTSDRLLSLPGYRSEVRLDSGVHVTVWGSLPEFSTIPVLESAITLNGNAGVDADVTLDHGRMVLSNHKPDGAARVRLRFLDEVWELTLQDARTEVSVELVGVSAPFSKEAGADTPLLTVAIFALAGQAQLKVRYQEFPLPGTSLFLWENLGPSSQGPRALPKAPDWWTGGRASTTREGKAMQLALDELSKRLTGKAPVERVLAEALKDTDDATRGLAVRCLMAMNNLPRVLDTLDDDKSTASRVFAIQSLRHWLGLTAENDKLLMQTLVQQKQYTERQAETVLQLLHGFMDRDLADPALRATLVEYLGHDRLPIRQLSHWLLVNLVPEGRKIPYDPAGETARREQGYEQWRRLVSDGKAPAKGAPPK